MASRKPVRSEPPPPATTSTVEQEKAAQRAFTGDKLDWMTALSADPRLDARAFEVGFQIAQHVNKETRLAILSDETICDKTAIPRRWIARARADLRNCGWIDWKRTKTANIYWIRDDHMGAVTDHQIMLKDCRNEKRTKLKRARQVLPPVAYLKPRVLPPTAHAELPPVAHRDMPPVANIHLSDYTVVDTPSKMGPSKEELIGEEEERYDPDDPLA
jgi:hypothetical protein